MAEAGPLRSVLRVAGRALRWILRAITWPLRAWWRAFRRACLPGRLALGTAAALLVGIAWLALAVPWPGYLFTPPFRAVEYGLMNDLQYLRPATVNAGDPKAVAACVASTERCATAATLAARARQLCAESSGDCANLERQCPPDATDPVCAESRARCAALQGACRADTLPEDCRRVLATPCETGEPTWQGWTAEQIQLYYHHPQGSAQVMLAQMRYAWFVALEQAGGRDRFAAPENMARYGFLTDLRQQPDPRWNPGNLPVGFTKYYDERLNAELLDFTCSLCHTGELHYNGTAVRVLGGQAMHAVTDMKPGQFQAEMMSALLATWLNPWKFDRFAHAVIDPTVPESLKDEFDFGAAKRQLRKDFGQMIRTLLANAWIDLKHGNYPVFEGYGRTDATQRIANTVFGRHISPTNYREATAPVSYPFLWDIGKFNWVQYEGYASQPMARNVNESLGVGARLDLFDENGAPLPMHLRYGTSIHPDRLHEIERTLASLQAPAWPEHLFGPIELPKARKGRALFDANCRHCHGPHDGPATLPADYKPDRYAAPELHFESDGTCWFREGEPLTPQQCLNLQNPQRVADIDGRLRYELDADGHIVGLACDREGDDPSKPKCTPENDHVPEWRVALLPIRDVGTDRNAALNFANNRYDASRLGWTADELRELCLPEETIASIDPKNLSAVEGLNLMSLSIARRYFRQHPPGSPEELMKYMGYGILDFPRTDPARLLNYKSRPLHGVWATPPFLHNGSVRTVFQMISPRDERERVFWSGTKEYDPKHLGYRNDPVPGAVKFDTSVTGNDNVGHEFNDGCQKNGIIGRRLSIEERYAILEYLKAMDYTARPEDFEPKLCDDAKTDDARAACMQGLREDVAREKARTPEWGSPAFLNTATERHCSPDETIYGDALPPTPGPDDVWDTWEFAAPKTCSVYRKLLQSEDTPGGR